VPAEEDQAGEDEDKKAGRRQKEQQKDLDMMKPIMKSLPSRTGRDRQDRTTISRPQANDDAHDGTPGNGKQGISPAR